MYSDNLSHIREPRGKKDPKWKTIYLKSYMWYITYIYIYIRKIEIRKKNKDPTSCCHNIPGTRFHPRRAT